MRAILSFLATTIASWDTDYPGNDLFQFGIKGDMASLISQCCGKCLATSGCAGYAIKNDVCYIKSVMVGRRSVNGVTTARRQ
ncbi:hypothetical protein SDRG_13575 [Saprolegnia diclina VS20]|uniref:Uncharacterized protein n=1 Tax=Saprolegnia diclina (strain VS20) TaxID=1156394 RepID=T0RG82_SAPDV|nr:hypothetical protein SDRG_13575 [Saprolegnia diclina VS20]EQC28702.1 hypothetical protein SDRG_13575 [Saprolegnia diclina VS20]|eukprot:XP_008617894.1 hypothetical protein SDRG_13575 [Saprolegnia diclina VS20]